MPVFPLVMGWPVTAVAAYQAFWIYPAIFERGRIGCHGTVFAEAQVNEDVLPEQYPFTMAHEFAHLLGVGSEAEADYFAFLVCMQSDSDAMRYSGYFSLLLCGGQCQEVIVR